MSVYVDALRDVECSLAWRWTSAAHLVADSLEELHDFARKIGLRRQWFQPHSFPHYDLTAKRHALALRHGAKLVGRHELVAVMRRFRSGVPA